MVISGSSTVRSMAQEALVMLGTGTDYQTRVEADRYLGRIGEVGDAPEALLAKTVKKAAAQRMKNDSSLTAQRIALQALAAGVTGAPSVVLARVACDILGQVAVQGDARQMGYTIIQGIVDNDTGPREKALSQAVYDVSGQELTHASGLQAQREGLKIIADSMMVDGNLLPACGIPHYGAAAVKGAATPEDSATIAAAVLYKLEGTGLRANDEVLARTIAHAAEVCSDKHDAAAVLKDGLTMLDGSPVEGVEAKLARFGETARSHAAFVDARQMGKVVLQEIASTTTDAKIKKLASQAASKSEPGMQSWWDRMRGVEPEGTIAAMQRKALAEIQKLSPAVPPEKEKEMLDELKKMAGMDPKAGEPKTIEVKDEFVVIGGVRIRKHAPADPSAAAATPDAQQTP